MLEWFALVLQPDDLAFQWVHRDINAQPSLGLSRPRPHGHHHLAAGDFAIRQDHPVYFPAAALQPLDVSDADGRAHLLCRRCHGPGEVVAVHRIVPVGVHAAQYARADPGFQLGDLLRFQPTRFEPFHSFKQRHGRLQALQVRLLQGQVYLGHRPVLVVDARLFLQAIVQAQMKLEALPTEGAQRTGDTDAGQRIQASSGVSRGLVAHAFPFDYGRSHPRLGQVVGNGAARRPSADDCNVCGLSHDYSTFVSISI